MRRFVVAEKSMSPALQPGDRYLARRTRRVRRGSVVFFPHPDRIDFWLAKRVVGLPGETVEVQDGEVKIGGEGLAEPWTTDSTSPPGRWSVPDQHVFVLSDARTRTRADSRTFGSIPLGDAYVAVFRYRKGGNDTTGP